ncbi:MAG: sigma 54-interacting transcriptional regulator [Clostridiales bacterium]
MDCSEKTKIKAMPFKSQEEIASFVGEQERIIEEQKQKIAALELRKAQYDSILKNMTEFVERSDPNFSLTYVNEAMCELCECKAEDLIGVDTMTLLEEDDRPNVLQLIRELTVENPIYHYEYHVTQSDNTVRWIEGLGTGFYDEEGNLIEYQDVGHDITHYKNLEKKLTNTVEQRTKQLANTNNELMRVNTYLQNILRGISEGIVVIDSDGNCEFLNYGPDNLWRRTEEEVKKYFYYLVSKAKDNVLSRLMNYKQTFIDVEMHCSGKFGEITFVASGMPLKEDVKNESKGILVLKPIEQVHNMVNKMSGAQSRFTFSDIVTNSSVLQDAIFLAKQGANSDCSILIEGESGTGKELFAQSIHSSSNRKNGPFVAINCGAIPRELVASELFGYMEGAFTGAKKGGKPGKFELANGGTLFLDEIGDMPMEQQISLLRVLQEKTVTRVGGDREIPIDVRIICATNKNLIHEVTEKNFREDLYYRLNVINFHIPPLRKRKEDIILLFSTFLKRWQTPENFLQRIDGKVLQYLVNYNWPGNVRELQNVSERVLYLSDGEDILPQYLPQHILEYNEDAAKPVRENTNFGTEFGDASISLSGIRGKKKGIKKEDERRQLLSALDANNGNVSAAARDLGLSRSTFYRRIREFKSMEN